MDNEKLALIEELQGILRDFQNKVQEEVEIAAGIAERKMMVVKKRQERMIEESLENQHKEAV